jgi:hypothetical protein
MEEPQGPDPELAKELRSYGTAMGAKLGCLLSVSYATILVGGVMVTAGGSFPGSLLIGLIALVLGWIVGAWYGISIGAATGALTARMLVYANQPVRAAEAGALGALCALMITALVHLVHTNTEFTPGKAGYLPMMGIPSAIYIVTSICAAMHLNARLRGILTGQRQTIADFD